MDAETYGGEALPGWSRGRWGGAPSGQRLFDTILVVRWLSLAVAVAGYLRNLTLHQLEYGHFLPVLAGLLAYTAVLTGASKRIYAWHNRSDLFLAVDYAVTLVAFSTTGTVWNPFLVFGACSFLFSGLRGNVRHGLVAGLVVGGLLLVSIPLKAVPYEELVATDGFILASVYVLQFVGFSTAWSFAVRLLGRLEAAKVGIDETRRGLTQTNAALDEIQRELLALHAIRHAILRVADAEETVRLVESALSSSGFEDVATWLLEEGRLARFPRRDGNGEIDLFASHPVAVAAHDRETVVTECGRDDAGDETLPPACIAAPILTEHEVFGVLTARNDTDAPLPEDRVATVERFAEQLALGFSHLRVYERARDLAVAEERHRVTSEIHRTVVQRLYEAGSIADSLAAEDVPADFAGRLQVLRDAVLGGLQDLRFAVLDWRRLESDSSPLELAKRYAKEFTAVSGMRVEVQSDGECPPLPASHVADLLRILQEALSNAWRHSGADEVSVRLEFSDGGVSMSVADDGGGFDWASEKGKGIGLRSMEERVTRNGGTLEIDTARGKGTRLRVWIPCR